MLEVTLLSFTPCPNRLVASIAKICYDGEHSAAHHMNTIWLKDAVDMVERLVESGHLSPLEHASFTFEISGISRACSHQLVRHRIASYTQQSQRYIKQATNSCIVPKEVVKTGSNECFDMFCEAVEKAQETYEKLIEQGVPKEDARYVLPEGTETRIIVTMNARELLHFFELRCCSRAQEEIRQVANKMLSLVKAEAPVIFKNAGAPCVHGECKEAKPCKKKNKENQ